MPLSVSSVTSAPSNCCGLCTHEPMWNWSSWWHRNWLRLWVWTQCLSLVEIVVLNCEDAATAEKMHGVFLEIIIAPSYTDETLAILTNKKKTCVSYSRYLIQDKKRSGSRIHRCSRWTLVQNQDVVKEKPSWLASGDQTPTNWDRSDCPWVRLKSYQINQTESSQPTTMILRWSRSN